MSKLDELFKELCPNGIKFVPLWSVTTWDKKFNGVARDMQSAINPHKYYLATDFNAIEDEKGDVPYIPTGIIDKKRFTTEDKAGDFLREGEIVCIPWGERPM